MSSWKDTVLANWEVINRLAVRRFGNRPLAEEAALFVMDGLLGNDAEKLRNYHGKGSIAGYLAALSWRLLEDFSRKRFGRRRAPLWIRNLGGVWLALYRLLCLERLDITESVAAIRQNSHYSSDVDPEEAAWTIRQQVIDCGAHQALEVSLHEEQARESAGFAAHTGSLQAELVEGGEKEELFRLLFSLLTDTSEEVVEQNLDSLVSVKIALEPKDKLLLKLCYQDGVNVARAGEMLGLNRNQTHGRLRRLFARLRDEFARAGLDETILEQLR